MVGHLVRFDHINSIFLVGIRSEVKVLIFFLLNNETVILMITIAFDGNGDTKKTKSKSYIKTDFNENLWTNYCDRNYCEN